MRILRSDTLVIVICAFVSVFPCIFSFSDISNKDSTNLTMEHNSRAERKNTTDNYFKEIYPNAGKSLIRVQPRQNVYCTSELLS